MGGFLFILKVNLPSFLWLWKIAAWSMGLSVCAYIILGISGTWMLQKRIGRNTRPLWLRPLHYTIGIVMSLLVVLLLIIGLVGTLGHYGSLGHSSHLIAGLSVVALVSLSFWSANQIHPQRPWARKLHLTTNIILFWDFVFVSLSGWSVVQKYLP